MAQRFAGIAYLKADGAQYPLQGNFVVSPSPTERTMISGQDYVHGWSEMPRVPYIEGDISTVPGLSTEAIEALTNATVQADLANGTTYVLQQAVCKSALEIATREGRLRVRFEGVKCMEISA
jgi:hypothetical protein